MSTLAMRDAQGVVRAGFSLHALAIFVFIIGCLPAMALPPTVDNSGGAGPVSDVDANLHGNLLNDGGTPPVDVWFYYGTTDGGTIKGSWDNAVPLGPTGLGPFNFNASGLTSNTMYFYRAYATNTSGEAWAPATTNFITLLNGPAPGPPMNNVNGGTQPGGPAYDFMASAVEIENREFVRFLNDAEINMGNNRGTNMFFALNGDVFFSGTMSPSEYLFSINHSRITYNPSNTPGTRYDSTIQFEPHPIVGVSWYGALKYCNWLTIDWGMPEAERCYVEGQTAAAWRPVTASSWPSFSASNRQDWLAYDGFRLPMDEHANTATPFNEYYLMAAWDGAVSRQYGFGRDAIDERDANFMAEVWFFDTQPVGHYNSSNFTTNNVTSTRDSQNAWGLNDVSGNVAEWVSDLDVDSGSQNTIRGGHFNDAPAQLDVSVRQPFPAMTTTSNIGFRVITTYDPATGPGGYLHVEMIPYAITGTPQNVTVTAFDGNGNIDTNYIGTVNFQSSDFSANLPGDYTFNAGDMGQRSFIGGVIFNMDGEHLLSAQDTNNFLYGDVDVHAFRGGGVTTEVLMVEAESPATIAGAWAPFLVIAFDGQGRVNTTYNDSLAFASTDGGATFGTPLWSGGFAFMSNGVQFATTGPQTLFVSDSVNSNVSAAVDMQVLGGGALHFVRKSGSNGNGGTGPLDAFQTINFALSSASPGDTIIVGGGEYQETITPLTGGGPGAPISIFGDPDGRYAGDNQHVIIRPGGTNVGFTTFANFLSLANLEFEGEGFFQGGSVNGVEIGGSNIEMYSVGVHGFDQGVVLMGPNARLEDCDFDNNYGPGVYVGSGANNAVIFQNEIQFNYTGILLAGSITGTIIEQNFIEGNYGAGVLLDPGFATIKANFIIGNDDGIVVKSSPTMGDIKNNFILNNATNGILVDIADPGTVIYNNTVYQNDNQIAVLNTVGTTIKNNILAFGGSNGLFIDGLSVAGTTNFFNLIFGHPTDWAASAVPGAGSLSVDPEFADLTPGNEDFHLKSVAGRFSHGGLTTDLVTSAAIDAGNPASAFSNEPSPNGGRVNMGAYGNTFEASLSSAMLVVDSLYGVTTPPLGTNMFPVGALVAADVQGSPFNVGVTQYVATGWIGTGDVPPSGVGTNLSVSITTSSTLTWMWDTQVFITVAGDPNGSVSTGNDYYTQGTNLSLLASPTNGYTFAGWSGDIVTNANPLVLTVQDALFLQPNFTLNTNSITVSSSHGAPTPPIGTQWFPEGSPINADMFGSPMNLGTTQYVALGWVGTGSAPASGVGTNFSFTLTSNSTIAWNWQTQVFLNVGFDPNGSVDVPPGFFIRGTNVTLTATPTNGFQFAGWSGDVVTNDNPLTLALQDALFVAPNFIQVSNSLTVVSDWGIAFPVVGTNWFLPGTALNPVIDGSPVTLGGTQYVALGWTGTGDVPPVGAGTNTSLVISNNSSITWNWSTNYQFGTAPSPNGSVDVANGFYSAGTNLLVTATPTNGYVFAGWTGDIVTNANPLNVTLASSVNLIPMFTMNSNSLTVASAYGTPTPAVGVNWAPQGQLINASLVGSPAVFGTTQYVATGWTGTGSTPVSGSGTFAAFNLTNNSTITWQWQQQVRLQVNPVANGGTDVGTGFEILNTNRLITAMPNPGFTFTGWAGDVPLPNVNDNPLTLLMDQARSITPTFAGAGNVTVMINPAPAAVAGGAWRLTTGPDTAWKPSGAVVSNLLTSGNPYTIVFTNLPGWTAPQTKTNVIINAGSTTPIAGTYFRGMMVLIPGGTFQMGIISGAGGVPTTLNNFHLDQHEVTVLDYQAFVAATPAVMPPPPPWNPGWANTALPMVNVSWNNASAYAAWIGKRLPTEAEYEYAMRDALADTLYTFGNAIGPANANYNNNVGQPTAPGSYAPSANYGLHDITGNVWEWCSDWFGPTLAGGNSPAGPGTGTLKIMRGGSYSTLPLFQRCANRAFLAPTTGYFDTGFRCAATAGGGGGGAAGGAEGGAAAASDPDADGDKVPDWWESAYFGIDASTIDGDDDSDKDGHSNMQEYVAGTDPSDAKSVFEATALQDGGSHTRLISWKSAVGKTYRIERTRSLAEPFVPVATGISASPPINSYTIPDPELGGFYRIVIE